MSTNGAEIAGEGAIRVTAATASSGAESGEGAGAAGRGGAEGILKPKSTCPGLLV